MSTVVHRQLLAQTFHISSMTCLAGSVSHAYAIWHDDSGTRPNADKTEYVKAYPYQDLILKQYRVDKQTGGTFQAQVPICGWLSRLIA